ncbi:unnamed protein product, partial [Rhizoctonia solani]
TIDEAEVGLISCYFSRAGANTVQQKFLLDQVPAPSSDEDAMVTKLRTKLAELLGELRKGAEGVIR